MNILFYLVPKSEVMYLYDDYSLRQAMEKMEYHKYSAVPIINRAGNYVGTLTEGDILWELKDRKLSNLHRQKRSCFATRTASGTMSRSMSIVTLRISS